jgi:hypothetical protein
MITLKQWMETVDYRITEGSQYYWNCFGDNAYSLDSWCGDQDGSAITITFDTQTQEVYEVQAHDYRNERSYRLINPDYVKVFQDEVVRRGAADMAWDDVKFTDLETDEDWLEKARAIFLGKDYDTRISIPLDIPDDELLKIMLAAHQRDMTFNQFAEQALQHAIDEFNRDPEGAKSRAKAWKESRDLA